MKKRIAFILALIMLTLCLTACERELKVDDPAMLELPGIKWGASPEEVKKAWKITEEQIFGEAEQGNRYAVGANNIPLFGAEVASAVIYFSKGTDDGEFKLVEVSLFYPDETDMTAMRDLLMSIYGPGTEQLGVTKYTIKEGNITAGVDSVTRISPRNGEAVMANWWASTARGTDVFKATELTTIINSYEAVHSADIVMEYLSKEPLVCMVCTDGAYSLAAPEYRNLVYFSAKSYVSALHIIERNTK